MDAAEYSEALATLASSATLSESCMELVSEALSLSFAEIVTLITASSDTHLHYITCTYSMYPNQYGATVSSAEVYEEGQISYKLLLL